MNKLVQLANSRMRVFNAQDLSVIWQYSDQDKLFELIKYYTRKCEIFTLARGLYSTMDYSENDLKNDDKLLYEIANKLVPNSYVSLYTVLAREGVIHQYYDSIYSVANRKVARTVKGVKFEYLSVKDSILFNDFGIKKEGEVRFASLERAVLDSKYLYPRWQMDFLEKVNQKLLEKGEKIYAKHREA